MGHLFWFGTEMRVFFILRVAHGSSERADTSTTNPQTSCSTRGLLTGPLEMILSTLCVTTLPQKIYNRRKCLFHVWNKKIMGQNFFKKVFGEEYVWLYTFTLVLGGCMISFRGTYYSLFNETVFWSDIASVFQTRESSFSVAGFEDAKRIGELVAR